MNNEIQFKIIRGKGSYGGSNSVKQINDILSLSKDANLCLELRILHCPQFSVLDKGIEVCKLLKNLNVSCNAIEDLTPLKVLVNLQALDVKANRIRTLKGIQHLRRLVKLDASQNRIETLEGFGESNNQIQSIILYKNNLKNVSELERFKTFKNIKEICFQKAVHDRSNPFCQNKSDYYTALQSALFSSKESLQKVDDLTSQQIGQLFKKQFSQQYRKKYEQESAEVEKSMQNHQNFNYSEEFQHKRSQNPNLSTVNALTSQKLMLMTQRQADLQRIIDMKGQTIDQMKLKYVQLEMANTNQYRQSIKKEVQFERVSGQISELSKAIDQKDHKINDLHKRIEELLKVNTSANNLADTRSQQLQKTRREFNQLRIENSELRVMNKDQENRLRELQNKALTNIEDKSHRIEQLRCKNEQLMKQNYELQHQQEEYKERIRQLTQLLKQWQTKYEQTVRELESYHNNEKEQIFREIQNRSNEASRRFDEAQRSLNQQWQDKMDGLQNQYSSALEGALQKYNRLKRAFDEKYTSEGELKTLLKSVMVKNTENENTIKEYEDAVIKSKKTIISLTTEHESLAKEHYQLKNRLENEVRHLQNQLSKSNFTRDKLERDVRELKASNQYLQKNFDNLNSREKDIQQLLQKNQNLQTALDAKNVMLDDKNETIQSLKLELQSIQKDQQGKIDTKEHQKLNQKYRRQKELLKSLEEQNNSLIEQNKELAQRCQVNNTLEQQFMEVKEIMRKQEAQIREKDETNTQLVYSLEKLKSYSQNLTDEVSLLKNEKNKLLHSLQQKETKWSRLMRQKQNQQERKLHSAQEQVSKYKQITEQFKNFTKTLNF